MTDRLVVVGAGIAGVSVAAGARAAGYEGEIVLLGAEDQLPYRRPPVSKEVVRGDKTADDIRIKKAQWYDDQRIDLCVGTRVDRIDPGSQVVQAGDQQWEYTDVVIATGGRPRTVATDSTRVHTLREVEDADALRQVLTADAHVLVVGAGLIGSEIAANARAAGAAATVLEADELPMPRVLPPELGRWCSSLHERHGTDLHTGVRVTEITDEADAVVVTADDGRTFRGTCVVLAVGMEPNVELASDAGATVAPATEGGGVVVDAVGRTDIEHLWAVGDVARMPNDVLGGDHRVEHWQNAQNHGTAVGRAIAGDAPGFHEVPWAWSDQYGHTIQVTGWPQGDHDMVVRGSLEDDDFTAFFLADGVLRAAVGVGRPREIRTARSWIAERARPEPARLADDGADLAEALVAEQG